MIRNRLEYEVLITKTVVHDAKEWCKERWGERWSVNSNRSGVWACFWAGNSNPGYYRFMFANEVDMILFALRWS